MKDFPNKNVQDILSKIEEVKECIIGIEDWRNYQSGVICQKCGCSDSIITNTRENKAGFRIRQRKCLGCGSKWNTVEIVTGMGCSKRVDD